MGESQLKAYRLLIVPGGNFEQIGNGLTPSATTNDTAGEFPEVISCPGRGSGN
jgi:hypothetical protein